MPKANAQKSLGLFSEPTYMGIGDPYDPPMERSGRAKVSKSLSRSAQ